MNQKHHIPRRLIHKTIFIETKEYMTIYSDLTGRYPIISSPGNQYIYTFYNYETNSIQATHTKTLNTSEIRDAKMYMLSTLTTSRHQRNIQILDNEALFSLKQGFLKNKIKFQLLPPYLHRKNASKRAIRTSKTHFIICLCTANTGYPSKEWDSFLPQETLNLNLLRNWHFNPKLSSHAAPHGKFDYNKTPLASIVTRVLVH